MSSLAEIEELNTAGRFADALRHLEVREYQGDDRLAADALRADLLEQVGRLGQARAAAEALLRVKRLGPGIRSRCEYVLARIDREDGRFESAIVRLQRTIDAAVEADDLEAVCWAQLRLLVTLSESGRSEAVPPLLAEVRSNTLRLGHRQVTAALHIFVGGMEARRGLTGSALRHTRVGVSLLAESPNAWLEADAAITNVAVAIMKSEFEVGLLHAQRAVRLAERSGRAAAQRAARANLGRLLYLTGSFDDALRQYEDALKVLPSSGDLANGAMDSVAQVQLLRGQIAEADSTLKRVFEAMHAIGGKRAYTFRHAHLTFIQLLERQSECQAAVLNAESLIQLANESGDHLLHQVALLTKAELLQQLGNLSEAMVTLEVVVPTLAQQPPDLWAQYERFLACALIDSGQDAAAAKHLHRARRIYESIHNVPGLLELSRRWEDTIARRGAQSPSAGAPRRITGSVATARDMLQGVVATLQHRSHAELVAREFVHLLIETDCVAVARAISRGDSEDDVQVLAEAASGASDDSTSERHISVGFARDRGVALELHVRRDVDAQATINAVTVLLSTVQDLERARAEREERIALWPVDEEEDHDGASAVDGGQMRRLMTTAKRIGTTGVSVLISGESGTGKEILARALHRHSDRSARPFIPFNCTAVPRDMLESQLFGYRRGSFTGADRDHPGMIGAARDGTLFLDEIGELGLDLQPKLLRFLESGEICPLGESTPFNINVRIIAATNADIEQLVKDGRFRDDLFYRLNVMRLKLLPLRERRDEIPALVRHFVERFAVEFHKGDIRVSDETMEHLLLCRWPGNVRQLQNEIRRMIALAEPGTVLTAADLSEEVFNARLAGRAPAGDVGMIVALKDKLPATIARIEREMIRLALLDHRHNLDSAARALGISRKGLYLKRQRLGL